MVRLHPTGFRYFSWSNRWAGQNLLALVVVKKAKKPSVRARHSIEWGGKFLLYQRGMCHGTSKYIGLDPTAR